MKQIYLVIAAAVFLYACTAEKKQTRTSSKMEVIAYYTGNSETIDQYSVEKLTQIIFSFGHLKGNNLHISSARDTATIQKLVSLKSRNPSLKVLLSLGGWGGCSSCSEVFSTEKGRRDFVQSTKELFQYFKTDGIDLDWEYPAIAGYPGHVYSPADKDHFTQLVQELRTALGKKAVISFAAGGFDRFLEQSIDWKKVMPLINNVNLMSYDLVSGFSKVTGHHTGLYSTEKQKQSADNAIRYFLNEKLPVNKIIIGSAFYARGWDSVSTENNGLYQQGVFKYFIPYKHFDRRLNSDSGFTFYMDSTALAPFAYNSTTKTFFTFDDKRSVTEKMNYVKKMKLGGIMFWELTLDSPVDGLLDTIDKERRRKQ